MAKRKLLFIYIFTYYNAKTQISIHTLYNNTFI
ncbi:hypothetical protein HMPREF9138_01876 [Prevotella histicola F0411]|uniref:Uncharacterized protein n=1 Tax=Prevotella histicola F0411 TaxID=857291 RepID=G6AIE9_9BACT|nr:hypothetical protein HMPREF9138_01876 [Prevotella histicola F0411]